LSIHGRHLDGIYTRDVTVIVKQSGATLHSAVVGPWTTYCLSSLCSAVCSLHLIFRSAPYANCLLCLTSNKQEGVHLCNLHSRV